MRPRAPTQPRAQGGGVGCEPNRPASPGMQLSDVESKPDVAGQHECGPTGGSAEAGAPGSLRHDLALNEPPESQLAAV